MNKIGAAMNQPPQTEKQAGKRIVSKAEYVKANFMRSSMALASVLLLSAAAVCGLGIVFLLLLLCVHTYLPDPEDLPMLQILLYAGAGIFLLGVGVYLLGKGAWIAEQKAAAINPGVPLTRANTADLPAPESLVRASVEPMQEPQAVLLRAATARQERHEEQLLRTAGVE